LEVANWPIGLPSGGFGLSLTTLVSPIWSATQLNPRL
jgi:hypothetical protein